MFRVGALCGVLFPTKILSKVGNCTMNLSERLLVVVRGILATNYRYLAGVKLFEAILATGMSFGVL